MGSRLMHNASLCCLRQPPRWFVVSRRVTWRRCEVKRSFSLLSVRALVKIWLANVCVLSRPIERAQHGTANFSTHIVLY